MEEGSSELECPICNEKIDELRFGLSHKWIHIILKDETVALKRYDIPLLGLLSFFFSSFNSSATASPSPIFYRKSSSSPNTLPLFRATYFGLKEVSSYNPLSLESGRISLFFIVKEAFRFNGVFTLLLNISGGWRSAGSLFIE